MELLTDSHVAYKSPPKSQRVYFTSEILSLKVIFMMGSLFFPLLICIALAFSEATKVKQCKEHETMFYGFCYSLSEKTASFGKAKRTCASQGGNLVSIHSEIENKFIRSLLNKIPVWIGGYESDTSEKRKWVWTDGTEMGYTNWAKGQPRHFENKVSVFMFPDGTWGNEYPSQEFSFVCKHEEAPTCDEGYFLYRTNCYSYKQETLGFADAQKKCAAEGGNLTSVHSFQEDMFLRKHTGDVYTWIGGRKDPSANGDWQWIDGTSFDFDLWAKDQPAQNPNNNCILMNYTHKRFLGRGDYGWSNELCDHAYGYVCKKPKREA